jgi:hypothetical protein
MIHVMCAHIISFPINTMCVRENQIKMMKLIQNHNDINPSIQREIFLIVHIM